MSSATRRARGSASWRATASSAGRCGIRAWSAASASTCRSSALLYLLVPQLWLSSVGLIEDPRRSITTLLLGCAGSIVLVALHRHRWQSGVRVATHVVPPLAVLWFMTGALPAATASPGAFGALGLAVAGAHRVDAAAAGVVERAAFRNRDAAALRADLCRLSRGGALWPPFRRLTPWHGALLFENRLNGAGGRGRAAAARAGGRVHAPRLRRRRMARPSRAVAGGRSAARSSRPRPSCALGLEAGARA